LYSFFRPHYLFSWTKSTRPGHLSRAVRSIETLDATLAKEVIAFDETIDQGEVEVEEEGLKILALHQPVAIDLRFIVAVLKINSDLERIGDLASNMAERVILLSKISTSDLSLDYVGMAEKVQKMLRQSLDALVNLDSKQAREICKADDEVDQMNREMYDAIKKHIREETDQLNACLYYLSTSRQLERIADHTTNIAEDVIYMVEGEFVRHHVSEQP
jgi:phosphate transport system protein